MIRRNWYRLFRGEHTFTWAILLLTVIPLFPEYVSPILAVASLIAALVDARARKATIQLGFLGKLLLCYIAYMAIGILYSAHPLNSLSTVAMWIVLFCGYFTVTTTITTRHRLHTALFVLSAVAAVVGALACVQYGLLSMRDQPVSNQIWLPLDEFVFANFPLELDLHMADHRPCSTFNNPNMLGEYLVIAIPFAGYCGFSESRTRRSVLCRIFVFFMIAGAALSFSRGAYIAMLSILLMILMTNIKQITPIAMCLVAGVALLPEAVMGRFFSIGQVSADGAIGERFAIWDVAIRTIVTSPLFGLGPGISNFWEHLVNAGIDAPHAHNVALQLLLEGGFIALFLLCMVALTALQNGLELANRKRHGSGLGNALMMFVVAFVVYGMVDYPFLSPKLVGNYLMLIGLADVIFHLYLNRPLSSIPKSPKKAVQNWVHSQHKKKF